jgi:phosphatidylinositol 4-phosphatase
VLDPNYTIHSIKGVTAIPLVEEHARMALKALVTRNAVAARSSLLAPITQVIPKSLDHPPHVSVDPTNEGKSPSHVTFADEEQVKILSPLADAEFEVPDRPVTPSSLASSTHSSDYSSNGAPIATTVSERLSFWNRPSKRPHEDYKATGTLGPVSAMGEREALDSMVHEAKEDPATILTSLLSKSAPPPATMEDKHAELEEKILRECIKSFAKGEMYFAYNFGTQFALRAYAF